ncbi:MAG: class I SAM-dependent methyltransferase [Rhizomicrobium sp.]|jgi:ubiquinone/menaquinone biosynthesis C-methylase UbiE
MPMPRKQAYDGIVVNLIADAPVATLHAKKPYKSFAMEGALARWYAKTTGADLTPFRTLAERIAARQPPGAKILEVAPGPGYLAIELARLGRFDVTGLDISRSFVDIAAENAAKARVAADFRVGNAAAMPLASGLFDFIVCRAAFKNFREPVGALTEMFRVLKPGGSAMIIDMRRDAANAAIDDEVRSMNLSGMSRFMTGWILKYSLRRRAYSPDDIRRMTAQTPFKACEIDDAPIGFEAHFFKRPD